MSKVTILKRGEKINICDNILMECIISINPGNCIMKNIFFERSIEGKMKMSKLSFEHTLKAYSNAYNFWMKRNEKKAIIVVGDSIVSFCSHYNRYINSAKEILSQNEGLIIKIENNINKEVNNEKDNFAL
ncbi:hypothetical protein [Buttiauxella gaviniae]|uniref:hypothetical protein n=1 Tax=Buttiauxella gaviniae TaxID=82990 RepID=UPI0039AF07F2